MPVRKERIIPVLTLALALGAPCMAAQAGAIAFSPYELEARDGSRVAAERGDFFVPENRSDPASRRIKLSFVRIAATKPSKRAPMVYLAGGPGGSGVDAARLPARFAIFMALREVADVIALDQRGTGWSNDIPRCPKSVELPLDQPTTRGSIVPALQGAATECARFWKDAGIDLAGYNTLESAADVDALREALGVPKISLWGISYGSHLALTILKRYPDRIERVALVGMEGLDETVKLPALTDAFFARLQASINAVPQAAKAHPDLVGTMRRVHARLDERPPSVTFRDSTGKEVTLMIGKFDVQYLVSASISDPSRSRKLLGLYSQMDAGDFSQVAPLVYELLRKPGAITFSGMPEAMDAASGISRSRAHLVQKQARTSLLGDVLNFPIPHAGNAFGVPDLGDAFRKPVRSGVPTLFLSGTLDGRTYPESAREIAARFTNGAHVIVENGGHNLFEASPLIREVIVAYMKGEKPRSATLTLPPPAFVQ